MDVNLNVLAAVGMEESRARPRQAQAQGFHDIENGPIGVQATAQAFAAAVLAVAQASLDVETDQGDISCIAREAW